VDWLHTETSLLLAVTGLPGCGKTVLSSFLVHTLSEKPDSLLVYSFCDDKITEQRTAHSILRTLILQLLRHKRHGYLPCILPVYNSMGDALLDSLGALWDLLNSMLDITTSQVFCVIDALDECEETSRDFFLDRIQELFTSSEYRAFRLKMIITSRPHVETSWSTWSFASHIRMGDYSSDLEHDVGVVIDDKISKLALLKKISSTEFLDQIRKELRQKSGGVFLWADLVLQSLIRGEVGSSEASVLEYIRTTPNGLDAVYTSLLGNINDKSRAEEGRRMLTWITLCHRPLKLKELEIALAIKEDDDSMVPVNRRKYQNIKYEIESVISPFVKILGEEVHLVHQSAKEFLLSHASQIITVGQQPGCPIQDGHLVLTRACLR
jgi:hypothetical protein